MGASDHFYSHPATDGERTLDDDITEIENTLSKKLAEIRAQPLGAAIDAADAAEIVDHLVPRTAHVRVNMERGLRMMANGIETILSNEDRVQALMGLDEDEPNETFRQNLANKLDEIEGIENLDLPESVIQRVAFFQAKENFASIAADTLPALRYLFSSWLQTSNGVVRDTHNRIVETVSGSAPRLRLLETLNWTIQSAQQEGAILPDCAALAFDQAGQAAPAMFADWKQILAIVLPLAPDKLLVGAAVEFDSVAMLDFNDAAARCSHDFFLAPMNNDYLTGLQKQLGQRSTKLVEDGVSGALATYLTALPKPRDEEAPLLPIDLIHPSAEPWQYELSLVGCGDSENSQELTNAIQGIVASLAQAIPLQRLDGITIASDYLGAVASLDRGYEGASVPDTAPAELGQGIARTISVKKGGRWKERIIIDAGAAFTILSEDGDAVDWGVQVVVRQLTEVAIPEIIERHLPSVWMAPISDPLHAFLYPNVQPAVFAYLVSHICAGFGDTSKHTATKRELLIAALGEMKSTALAARFEYRYHGDLDRLLEIVMPRISYALQFAADLLGHCAASADNPFDAEGELSAGLADSGLEQWFPIFGDQLERFRMRLGRWESFDEFLALDVHVERLMWQLGFLPWSGPKGVRIEVPIGSDIEKLHESTNS